MRKYRGQCHCGVVQFEITTALDRVVRCNCSICRRRSAVMCYVDAERFVLFAGREYLTEYQFHTKTAMHFFCKVYGIFPFLEYRNVYCVNVGCLEGVDPYEFEPELIDGRSF